MDPAEVQYAYSENGEICFDLPENLVDWEALARDVFGSKAVDHPDRITLEQNSYPSYEVGGSSSIKYSAPTTEKVLQRKWTLIHEAGAVRIHPHVLRGEVDYQVDDEFNVIGGARFFGKVCAPPPIGNVRAAFVMSGISIRKWTILPGSSVKRKGGYYSFKWKEKKFVFQKPDLPDPPVEKIVVFLLPLGNPRALVVWHSDPFCKSPESLCCGFVYSLHDIAPSDVSPLIAENIYGCDI